MLRYFWKPEGPAGELDVQHLAAFAESACTHAVCNYFTPFLFLLYDLSIDHPSVVRLAENPSGIGRLLHQSPPTRIQNVAAANAERVNAPGKKRGRENAKSTSVGLEATTILRKSVPEKEVVIGGTRAGLVHKVQVRVPRPLRACPRTRVNGSKSLWLRFRLS